LTLSSSASHIEYAVRWRSKSHTWDRTVARREAG